MGIPSHEDSSGKSATRSNAETGIQDPYTIGGIPPRTTATPHGLSKEILDLNVEAFNPKAADEIKGSAELIGNHLRELAKRIRDLQEKGELVREEFQEEIPEGWQDSPGNPAYLLDQATKLVEQVYEGMPCTKDFERSVYKFQPGSGEYCCDNHDPWHCIPAG